MHNAAPPRAEGLLHRALAALGGIGQPVDAARCLDALHAAASAGDAPAARSLGMAWASAGDPDAARACFTHAVVSGDAMSAFLLARLSPEADASRALDAFAFRGGIARAQAFLADTATGEVRLPTPATSSLPPPPEATVFDLTPFDAVVHHAQPSIATFDDVLKPLDGEYVIGLASGRVQRSLVHDPASGGPMRHPMRTSQSMTFPVVDADVWLRQLQRRLAALTGLPFAHAEPLAVLRYARGEEYRPHRDYLRDPGALGPDAPGQRVRTVFAYLSDVAAGGETDFPLLGVRIAPRRGRVVMFDNVRPDGSPDADTLHAGLPVAQGRKWLATLWMRERPLRTA